jgi:hypothetical protein
VMYVVHSE